MSPVLEPQEDLATKPIKIKSPIKRMKREEKKKKAVLGRVETWSQKEKSLFKYYPIDLLRGLVFIFKAYPLGRIVLQLQRRTDPDIVSLLK